jgi:glutamate-ammonia-ligase adenylyltransferase
MGKTGGRELNYVSDVDVIYVVEPAEGATEAQALAVGTKLATALARACSAPSGEPALWEVDAALRPEGKQGPLVRTLASHVAYYERWAKTWEFQALLKARAVAGDSALGQAYAEAIGSMVWEAVGRENFVEDSQAMRRRVEAHIPAADAERQLKLGAGGLRDVEFTVQLLQLLHGATHESLRTPETMTALEALVAVGLIEAADADALRESYELCSEARNARFLVTGSERESLPTDQAEAEHVARLVGYFDRPQAMLRDDYRRVTRHARQVVERLFYGRE